MLKMRFSHIIVSSVYIEWSQNLPSIHKTSNLWVDELKQQKTTMAPVSQEQKSESIKATGSPKLDN